MKYLLEYSEKQHAFHLNYKETTGQWHNELFVNDYRPITIVDEETIDNDKTLEGIMNYLCNKNSTYENVASEILFLLLTVE